MKRGRRKRPTKITEAMGNPGKRKIKKNEPKPDGLPPEQIDGLDDTGLAKYRQMRNALGGLRLLTSIDADALMQYAWAYQEWVKCRDFIAANGSIMSIKDAAGKPKYIQQVPQVSMARQYWAMMYRLQQEFGMTPSARASLSVDPETSPMEITQADVTIDDFRTKQFDNAPPTLAPIIE